MAASQSAENARCPQGVVDLFCADAAVQANLHMTTDCEPRILTFDCQRCGQLVTKLVSDPRVFHRLLEQNIPLTADEPPLAEVIQLEPRRRRLELAARPLPME